MNDFDKEEYLISLFDNSIIGDDGAIIEGRVYSMDSFNEDIHFKREWMSMSQIGTKAMLVNISDAIAMNAVPLYALVAVSLPNDISKSDIMELVSAMKRCAGLYGCDIIGGDTTAGEKLNITITIISTTSDALKRDDMQDEDLLAFTGRIGQSKMELAQLLAGKTIANDSRFYAPVLRGDFIRKSRSLINSGMDISDGLFCDTNRMLDINNYGISILNNISQEMGSSGEEYEMLISFNIKNKNRVLEIAKECEVELTIFAQATSANIFRYPCKSHHF